MARWNQLRSLRVHHHHWFIVYRMDFIGWERTNSGTKVAVYRCPKNNWRAGFTLNHGHIRKVFGGRKVTWSM